MGFYMFAVLFVHYGSEFESSLHLCNQISKPKIENVLSYDFLLFLNWDGILLVCSIICAQTQDLLFYVPSEKTR